MDGHDEADHERRHEERPCPPPPGQADHGVVDRSPRGSARLCSEAEQTYQRDHCHCASEHIEKPRPRRLGPEHVSAEGYRPGDGHEPRASEARDQPLLQSRKNRSGVACNSEHAEQAGKDQ